MWLKNIFSKYIFVTLLVFIGCGEKGMPDIKILALGDSYTIGESVAFEKSWPMQLSQSLAEKNIKSTVKIIAKTGWTTDELNLAIEQEKINTTYKLVTLSIGVNNQYRDQSIDVYRREFCQLLEKAIKFANNMPSNVIVVSIPDWGVTPFGHKDKRGPNKIGNEIAVFNQVNLEESKKRGCNYIDITPVSKQALNKSYLTASDGLHPSAKMYTMWVDKISPIASKIGSQ